ncbi:MAG: ATP-binding protein [Bacteroidales bacterium]|nr:ATP-binding protein [Bacteroidales bacterium]MCF0186965.1 ATP-binding protein [Bacteroidaceae bacterium]
MANRLFTFGKPAKGESFTDRKKETAKLVSNFKYGVNTFIVSPRRWGKTSLVLKAADEAKSDKLKIVFADVFNCKDENQFCEKLSSAVLSQTYRKVDELIENAKSFLNRITFEVGLTSDPSNPIDFKLGIQGQSLDIAAALELPQKIAEKQKVNLVICIDEFQQIGEFSDSLTFQKTLRTAWQHQDNVTYCLFGSRKHMMENLFADSTKPFYKFGDVIYLDCIPVDYWTGYIQERFAKENKRISSELCARICDAVAFNSSYVQQLSWYLFQETETEAAEDNFTEALNELILQNAPVFEQMTSSFTAYQMNFLYAVADGVTNGLTKADVISKYKLGSSANVTAISKLMLSKDIIQETENGFVLTDAVFGLWLIKTRP